jgi:DNA adenine methylase
MLANSPLRYPGGKSVLSEFFGDILIANGIRDGNYVEPYAGGAGAALNLLFAEHVQQIILNDADPCIHAFWNAILTRKNDFIKRLKETSVTIAEWERQRDIYRQHDIYSHSKVALAGFYLNRCNRSGIMVNGGPIGGFSQKGKWELNARFNKEELIRRIDKIHLYRDRITIYNMDAIAFLRDVIGTRKDLENTLIYLDPPYFGKGMQLYLNYYNHEDHIHLARFVKKQRKFRWLMTYDNVPEIRSLYQDCRCIEFNIPYSVQSHKIGSELLIHGRTLSVPDGIRIV